MNPCTCLRRIAILTLLLLLLFAPPQANAQAFTHPGILNNQEEMNFIRDRVREGVEPWQSAFRRMTNSPSASLSHRPQPREVVECGPYSRPDMGCSREKADAIAAYTHALLWQLTGKKEHSAKAIEIMNAWSAVVQEHKGHNAPLQSSWAGAVFPRAAEIIRHTSSDWQPADIERFSQMLRKAYLPHIQDSRPNYNGNWELSMIEAMAAIGVFLDDRALFDQAMAMWRKRVPAYFYLSEDGEMPAPPPDGNKTNRMMMVAYWHGQTRFEDGLCQETCRDFGHTLMGLGAMVNTAEIARQQGVDLYGEQAKRITAAMEFHADYILGKPVPEWLGGGRLSLSAGQTWEIAYNHYHNRMGLALPLTEKVISTRVRPTGSAHHMVWETLTHGELGDRGRAIQQKR